MSQDKRIVILAGGEIRDLALLRSRLNDKTPEAVICADGGARHAQAIGLIPRMIVGDMDSLPADLLQMFADQGTLLRRYPAEKDETDTELAFEAAMEYQPSEIWVYGALGYRLDHTLANLSLLLKGEARQIRVKLLDEYSEILLVTNRCTLDGEIGQTVSILPFFGMATGVSLDGFAYPLKKGTMSMAAPFGVSNRLIAPTGTISLESGGLLVIRYFREGVFPS